MRHRITVVAMAAVVAAGVLGGCAGDEKDAATPKSTVLVPGRPGEPNQTTVKGSAPAKPPTAAEIRFVEMMIPHHEQALAMSSLAPGQAAGTKVKALAGRIEAAQGVEISAMQSWQRTNVKDKGKATGGGHGGHRGQGGPSASASPGGGHASMPGMATPQQLEQLRAARGAAFDKLYLQLMITHHEGALTMVKDVVDNGTDVTVQQLARDVQSSQQAEIGRMRALMPR